MNLSATSGVCIRQTEIPSTSRLFADFLHQFDGVSEFYRYPPRVSSIPEAAANIELDPAHRRTLVAALREGNADSGPATARHLDLLSKPGTMAITTGQQVGLYGGPVFALYKALSALKLAEQLRQQGAGAVAVFWLATEDHDLAEVDHAWVLDHAGEPLKIQAQTSHEFHQPVGQVTILDNGLEKLASSLAGLPFADEALALARQAWGGGTGFQKGFTALFQRLLEPYGLIFLDPMHPSLRKLAATVFRSALERSEELNLELMRRSRSLEQKGYHAQVRVTEETSLLFLIEDGRRMVLRRAGSGFSTAERTYSTAELLDRLARHPEEFSPNALLRPVTQDFLLPTAAYIGGPAELAYLAQAAVLYDRLLGRMPVVMPRASFTILDSKAGKLLEKYGLALSDCFDGARQLRTRMAGHLIPPGLEQHLDACQTQIEAALASASEELQAFDPTLSQALGNASKKMLHQFGKIRSKAGQESLRRDSRAESNAAYLSQLILPNEVPQERLFAAPSFLARYGLPFIENVYQAIQPDCPDHQVISL